MAHKKGKWWGGGYIVYLDNNRVVRIRAGMWWVGLAMLISLGVMLMNPEWKGLSLEKPWQLLLTIGVLFLVFALAFALIQHTTFYADKSKDTYRLSWKWLGIPIRKQNGKLHEIKHIIIKEHVSHTAEIDASYLHIYIKARDHELYLFQISEWFDMREARKLAVFLGCPMIFTDKGYLQEGTYERIESLKELQKHFSLEESASQLQ